MGKKSGAVGKGAVKIPAGKSNTPMPFKMPVTKSIGKKGK